MRDQAHELQDLMSNGQPVDPERVGRILDEGWQLKRGLASTITTNQIDALVRARPGGRGQRWQALRSRRRWLHPVRGATRAAGRRPGGAQRPDRGAGHARGPRLARSAPARRLTARRRKRPTAARRYGRRVAAKKLIKTILPDPAVAAGFSTDLFMRAAQAATRGPSRSIFHTSSRSERRLSRSCPIRRTWSTSSCHGSA